MVTILFYLSPVQDASKSFDAFLWDLRPTSALPSVTAIAKNVMPSLSRTPRSIVAKNR